MNKNLIALVIGVIVMGLVVGTNIQNISAQSPIQSPINTTSLGPNDKALILNSISPFNITFSRDNTTFTGVVTIPDINIKVDPKGGSDIIYYTCTTADPSKNEPARCESKKGNVQDGIDLFNDRDKVCKDGMIASTDDQAFCEWNGH